MTRGIIETELWRDPSKPVADRVEDLMRRMTLREKLAQLYSVWLGASRIGEEVAPLQHELLDADLDWKSLIVHGLGQLTRVLGTAPITAEEGAQKLASLQTAIVAANRFGIPAVAHEECLTGFTTMGATIFPTPLAWGAAFDPALVERAGVAIGDSLRSVGAHQGLAPVLDVVRDPRWGRTEETIGEDPYLVATVATAYVRGMESSGVVATLKHFAGYSASRAGRNFAPVSMGRRELFDVILPPFEMAIRDGGARSVMHAYADVDGVPPAADPWLLTELLRTTWGFEGTVVADYFGVAFLHSLHGVAQDIGDAAVLALAAGVDVELPSVRAYAELMSKVEQGLVPEELIDRSCRRVLRQKCELGLLDPDWTPQTEPPGDLDSAGSRSIARQLAEESVVLLSNDAGVLPLRAGARLAVVGPLADDPHGMLGCYTYPRHVGLRHNEPGFGVEIMSVLGALRAQLPEASIAHASGCTVSGLDTEGFAAAVAAARSAEVCLVVLGDHAAIFRDGTSGEGCDVDDLNLPGVQGQLLDAVLATGTPVVVVMLSGRPYALGAYADRVAAIVQAFFPGEEGGPAVAGVLTGAVCPSGRLPVSMPRLASAQPFTYLTPPLGYATEVSSVDPTPLYPFGHGLSYTSFAWECGMREAVCATDGTLKFGMSVRNTGDRSGSEIVQVYLHDPVAQVTRPVMRLIGYARVPLEPGQAKQIEFTFDADLTSFTGRDWRRVVEPGAIELRLAASTRDVRHVIKVRLDGGERIVDHQRQLTMGVSIADI